MYIYLTLYKIYTQGKRKKGQDKGSWGKAVVQEYGESIQELFFPTKHFVMIKKQVFHARHKQKLQNLNNDIFKAKSQEIHSPL